MLNVVLVGLGVDYLLAGLLWLATNASEKLLSRLLTSQTSPEETDGESRQLLNAEQQPSKASSDSQNLSWHVHNAFLLVLTIVTIMWNKWLSPFGGQCPDEPTSYTGTSLGLAFDFWFYPVSTEKVLSSFPPLGWISFSILGLLYGRVVIAHKSTPSRINTGNVVAGISLLFVFALTRLLNVGNLSEECLRMPEQLAHPDANQYLLTFQSFFYIIKYPPDLAYFAYTMGVNFLLLAFFGALPVEFAKRIPGLMVFGTSALFFYTVHIIYYFEVASILTHYFGHELEYDDPMTGKPAVGIDNYWFFWIYWLVGLVVLYPLCRWYGGFKNRKGPNSIWRFF
jgi:hypothetical protein